MSWLKHFLTKRLDFLLLSLVLLVLFATNYTSDTFLVGWDNLLPELNPLLNIKRSFLAVWQQYQGLGLVGGMAHSSDLIHQLIILPLSWFLPTSLIRYLWQFATIALGTFGMRHLLKKHFTFPLLVNLSASLFYLLHFGSVQNFYTPFEPFSVFWGFFPWLISFFWTHLDHPTKKNLIALIALNLLASPSFYVPTIFIVYLICLGLISLSHFLATRPHFSIKTQLKPIALIILINAFWLIPFLFFVKNDIGNTRQYFGNLIGSQEVFDRNQRRGNLSDFLILRGFYYDYQTGQNYLLSPWLEHYQNAYHLTAGYLLSVFVIIGLISLLIQFKKLDATRLSIMALFLLSCLALLSNQFPFNFINSLFRQISLLDQVFRSPFTKFITPAVFSFSLLSAFGLNFILHLLKSLKYSIKLAKPALPIIFITLLFVFSYPSFTGNYLYQKLRQPIKSDYFDLFAYLKTQPKTARIANLPSGNFWGWSYYNFGITGSGFIWYAIDQPILDRAFDVWSQKNEHYYWQLDNALQKQDPALINKLFEKYSIQYVLFDDNLFYPYDKVYAKNSVLTKNLLSTVDQLKLEKQFGNLSLYRFLPIHTDLCTINHPISINSFGAINQDYAFNNLGDYISTTPIQLNFPYIDIFSKRLPGEFNLIPQVDQSTVSVGQYQFPFDPDNPLYNRNLITLNHPDPQSPYQQFFYQDGQFFRFFDQTSQHSFGWDFPEIGLNQSYLLKVEYRHLAGHPLKLAALGGNNRFKFFETLLSASESWTENWFVIPKQEDGNYNPGLNISVHSTSFNLSPSINDIKAIKLYPFPYQELSSTNFLTKNSNISTSTDRRFFDSTSNIFYYKTQIDGTDQYLVLPQSFHKSWLAFYFSGLKPTFLKDHVLVNNWANGWKIDENLNNKNIYILFWPQLLQFLGFSLIPLSFFWILKKTHFRAT